MYFYSIPFTMYYEIWVMHLWTMNFMLYYLTYILYYTLDVHNKFKAPILKV